MTDELRAETIRIAENARQYRRVLEQMVADARSRPPDPTLAVAVSVDMLALLLDDLAATPEPAPDMEAEIDVDRLAEAMRRARQAVAWTPSAVDIAVEYRALHPADPNRREP